MNVNQRGRFVEPNWVLDAVSDETGVDLRDTTTRSRAEPRPTAKAVACLIFNKWVGLSLHQIKAIMGYRSHSSVVWARDKAAQSVARNPNGQYAVLMRRSIHRIELRRIEFLRRVSGSQKWIDPSPQAAHLVVQTLASKMREDERLMRRSLTKRTA